MSHPPRPAGPRHRGARGAGVAITPGRRPRFGEIVRIGGERFTVVATVCAPHRGYWIRPAGADDAERDRFLPLAAWAELRWNPTAQLWELDA